MRQALEKRFSFLYSGELSAVVMFIFVSIMVNRAYPELHLYSLLSFWASFLLLEFLLIQGSFYWYSKWRRLKREKISVTPMNVVQLLWKLKKWNIGLISLTSVAFVADFMRWSPTLPIGGLSLSCFIYIFAILEYINYFHIQLSYDNRSDIEYLRKTKRLKKSSLNRDFMHLKK
ncbi:general stress protein [Niallia oryzisoli]|uniref:General stress protein n=1 Tax=Niallia oryzisoli TaxID=1737571 RepID=A0ABZ2CIB9_9BACI